MAKYVARQVAGSYFYSLARTAPRLNKDECLRSRLKTWLPSGVAFGSCDLFGKGEAGFGFETIDFSGVYVAILAFTEGQLSSLDGFLYFSVVDLLDVDGLIREDGNLVAIYFYEAGSNGENLDFITPVHLNLTCLEFGYYRDMVRKYMHSALGGRQPNLVYGLGKDLGVGSDDFKE